jgi:azurin
MYLMIWIKFVLMSLITLLAHSTLVFGADCQVKVTGSDAMQYDVKEIEISKDCDKFTIELTHGGQLPAAAMGHNVVIVETSKMMGIATTMIKMENGIDNGFLPESSDILFKSKMVGGGESTTLEIDTAKLSSGTAYTFFCSFPGHWAIMKGDLTVL